MKVIKNQLLLFVFTTLLLSACGVKTNSDSVRYSSWDGLEPDKWASVWLINRYIDNQAEIILRPVGAATDSGITFGVPGAKYSRSHGTSVYESLRSGHAINDPVLIEVSNIISDNLRAFTVEFPGGSQLIQFLF